MKMIVNRTAPPVNDLPFISRLLAQKLKEFLKQALLKVEKQQ